MISLKDLTATIMIVVDDHPEDIQHLRLAWPSIWQWIQFILLHCCTSSVLPIQALLQYKDSAYVVTMYLLIYFASVHERFKAQINTTPGALLVGLITKWWKQEAQGASGRHFSAGLLVNSLPATSLMTLPKLILMVVRLTIR